MGILEVDTLRGRYVTLEPMSAEHIPEIAAASTGDRASFGYTQVPDGRDEAATYVDWLLDQAEHHVAAPFVQRRVADGLVVGCTRFLNPLWPLGRRDPDEVEIGGTWLAADAQRTPVNTEAKLLLLTHAFDEWRAQRVAICTDAGNDQSRRAIERIGGVFEGVLRRHRPSTRPTPSLATDRQPFDDGRASLRDTAVYSIIGSEWPTVRDRLTDMRNR